MKYTPVLVMKQASLANLAPGDKNLLRHALMDCITGIDEKHTKRWRRIVTWMLRSEPGEVMTVIPVRDRDGRYHRMHMKFEGVLFDSQEKYRSKDRFRDWLKTGAGYGEYRFDERNRMRFVPGSLDFDNCSDDEMREFHEAAVDWMQEPLAQRKLWPHLNPQQRADMVAMAMRKREEN